MSGAIHEKHKFKYFKNLTVKVCKTWCNDVYTSILQCDIFWWKLIDRNFFNPIFNTKVVLRASPLFSSPGLGVCRLLSVVCKLFTFQASSPKSLGRLEPNLAGMFLVWSSTKLLFFVPVGYSIWLPGPIICSDWLKFQRSSSLKLMNWLNLNCTWMIIGMSFTKLLFFMPIGNPRWPPSQDID